MFLHIGSDVILPYREIVVILDAQLLRQSAAVRDLVALAQLDRRVVDLAEGQPRSIVVADRGIYLSPISVLTLRRRGSLLLEEQLGGTGDGGAEGEEGAARRTPPALVARRRPRKGRGARGSSARRAGITAPDKPGRRRSRGSESAGGRG
ncbi:MAG TPA: extracellular matrix/biofilm biosynthesis regulator RemA family protein [Thermaerobacter sp.]